MELHAPFEQALGTAFSFFPSEQSDELDFPPFFPFLQRSALGWMTLLHPGACPGLFFSPLLLMNDGDALALDFHHSTPFLPGAEQNRCFFFPSFSLARSERQRPFFFIFFLPRGSSLQLSSPRPPFSPGSREHFVFLCLAESGFPCPFFSSFWGFAPFPLKVNIRNILKSKITEFSFFLSQSRPPYYRLFFFLFPFRRKRYLLSDIVCSRNSPFFPPLLSLPL